MFRRIWLITRAELEYHGALLIACFSLFIALALGIGLRSHGATENSFYVGPLLIEEISFMFLVVIIGHAFITFRMITTQRVEQHLRLLLPLPVNRVDIVNARLNTVLVLHAISFFSLFVWIFLVMNAQDIIRLSSRYMNPPDASWIRWQVVWSALTVITISMCLSYLILLLESRVTRPLLSTVIWVLFLIPVITIIRIAGGRPITFISHDLARIAVSGFRRGGVSLVSFLLVFVLLILILAYIYHARIRRQNAYRAV